MKRYAAIPVLMLLILCSGCIPVKPSYVESTVISGFPVPAEARLVEQGHHANESWGPPERRVHFTNDAKYAWRGGPLINEQQRMIRYRTEIAAQGWETVDELGSLKVFRKKDQYVRGLLWMDSLHLYGQ